MSTFDDSQWTQGTGGIGYGDSDDQLERCLPSVRLE